ncbi:hypothetical protein CPB85DRAFT_1430399 [Mucidula mucida]|nr:hypothetical protein CPB85DRAFT_1430399 [Mucidula mucida]
MSHNCSHCGLPSTKKSRRIPAHSPYETHLGTNIAFIAQDHVRVDIVNLVANAKADVADLDRHIEKLEAFLAAAKSERDETIAFRDAHLALFPAVHQLPTEVLLEIFHLTFEKPYDVFASSRSGPWLLGKVCSRWRQVAWSCASLWTDFTLTDGGPTCMHQLGTKNLLEGALSRSAQRNKFHMPLGSLKKSQANAIPKGAGNWHDVSFSGAAENFLPFHKIRQMPSLVALELEICIPYRELDIYYQRLSQHVPQLRRLTLAIGTPAIYHTDVKMWRIEFPWSQLTELIVPLDDIVTCQHLLACCPELKTLKDHPHLSQLDRMVETPHILGLQPVVAHTKMSSIDMSSSIAISLLDHVQFPALTHLSVPCPRAHRSDIEIFQRFIQRSDCRITRAEFSFKDHHAHLASPEAYLSALLWITGLQPSFRVAEGLDARLIDCLSDPSVVPQLRVLTITSTVISRSIWNTELQDTLIRVLIARYQPHQEGTNLQEVVIVLGREMYMTPGERNHGSVYYLEGYPSSEEDHKRHLPEHLGRDCTIEDPVDTDFVEFQKFKDRGLDIRLSMWKGRTLIRYVSEPVL